MDIEKPLQVTTHADALLSGQFFFNGMLTRLVLFPDSLHFQNDKIECTYALTF